jgi:NTE family protein
MSFGLVLSGGAAYGIANAGVLKVFEEHAVRPDVIAGSSMGAIVAALFALGHNTKSICALTEKLSPLSVVKFSEAPLKGGFHGGLLQQQLALHLGPLIGDRTIGETKIPFVCVAGKVTKPIVWSHALFSGFLSEILESVEPYIFPPETRILDALAASSALPVIFSPVEISGESFVDLCDFGAVPSRSLRKRYNVDLLIATNTAPSYPFLRNFMPPGMKEFMDGAKKSLQESLTECDLVIAPTLHGTPFEFQRGDEFIQSGQEATEQVWPKIEELLHQSMK